VRRSAVAPDKFGPRLLERLKGPNRSGQHKRKDVPPGCNEGCKVAAIPAIRGPVIETGPATPQGSPRRVTAFTTGHTDTRLYPVARLPLDGGRNCKSTTLTHHVFPPAMLAESAAPQAFTKPGWVVMMIGSGVGRTVANVCPLMGPADAGFLRSIYPSSFASASGQVASSRPHSDGGLVAGLTVGEKAGLPFPSRDFIRCFKRPLFIRALASNTQPPK